MAEPPGRPSQNSPDQDAPEPLQATDPDLEQKVAFLRDVSLFQYLDKDGMTRLASRVREVSLPAGHVLKENEPADGLYIIRSGLVKVTKPAASHQAEVDLAVLSRGNFFGEIGLIDGLPRSASVTALEPTECYFLPRPVYITAVRENPEIALGMLPALAAMVRNADQIAQTLLDMLLKDR